MARELTERITEYLALGGLVNPEMMDHGKVRDLLIDCRDALVDASPSETTGGEVVAWEVRTQAGELLDTTRDATRAKWWAGEGQDVRALVYSAPHARDGVPEVTEDDVQWVKDHAATLGGTILASRILAALSYCATRQGEGHNG